MNSPQNFLGQATRLAVAHAGQRRQRSGLSLVEVLVASMLLTTLAMGAMTTLAAVNISRNAMNDRTRARELALVLLSEVLQTNYRDPQEPDNGIGRDSKESVKRGEFDDVDDYHLWNESPPTDRGGAAIEGFGSWKQQVWVQWLDPVTLQAAGSETGLKQITVRVTDPTGKSWQLQAFRSLSGANEQLPFRDTKLIRWIGLELQVGADSPSSISAANLVNHASEN